MRNEHVPQRWAVRHSRCGYCALLPVSPFSTYDSDKFTATNLFSRCPQGYAGENCGHVLITIADHGKATASPGRASFSILLTHIMLYPKTTFDERKPLFRSITMSPNCTLFQPIECTKCVLNFLLSEQRYFQTGARRLDTVSRGHRP